MSAPEWEWPETEDGVRVVGPIPIAAAAKPRTRRKRMLKAVSRTQLGDLVASVVDFAGLGSLIYGIQIWSRPAAFVAAGVILLIPAVKRNLPSRRHVDAP